MLRKPNETDAASLLQMRSNTVLQHLLMANPADVTDDNELAKTSNWIKRRMAHGWFKIIEDDALTVSGFAQIYDIHHKNRFGWLGLGLLPLARGKGLGVRALVEIERAARIDLKLRKLLLHVRSDNRTAIALYDRSGGRRVGVLYAHYDDGTTTYDVILFEKQLDVF
jgi:RimJ/RimL family protein N-acetyltransferase